MGEQDSNLGSSTAEPTLLIIMWYIHLLIILQGYIQCSQSVRPWFKWWGHSDAHTTVFISRAYRRVRWKHSACLPPTWAIGQHKTYAMMDIDFPLVVHLGKTSSNRKLGQRDNWDWDRGKWTKQREQHLQRPRSESTFGGIARQVHSEAVHLHVPLSS